MSVRQLPIEYQGILLNLHSRESGNPGPYAPSSVLFVWTPAFAGVTRTPWKDRHCSRTDTEDLAALVVHELEKLGLTLSRDKTGIYSPEEPIEFLGMELCLGKGAGKYQLIVSKSQMKEIRSSFRHYHDFDAALREGLDAARLFCRLQQMQLGYAAAYKAADNLAVLEECLGRWVQECAKTVYESIFGRGKVSNLTAAQRRFLMIA